VTSSIRRDVGCLGQASLRASRRSTFTRRRTWLSYTLDRRNLRRRTSDAAGRHGRRQGALVARAHGEAPRQSDVCRLSQGDGSHRASRSRVTTASGGGERPRTARRSTRQGRFSTARTWMASSGFVRVLSPAGDLRRRDDREDVDLRAWSRPRVLRHAGRAQDRTRREEQGLSVFIDRARCRTQHAVPDEGGPVVTAVSSAGSTSRAGRFYAALASRCRCRCSRRWCPP